MSWADPALVADATVNIFAAGGAIIVAAHLSRSDPHGSLTRRIVYSLYLVSALFLVRATSWLVVSPMLERIVIVLAALTPLFSLFVAEWLMRRHAPLPVKLALLAMPAALLLLTLLPFVPALVISRVLLVAVTGGFASIAWLIWTRDTQSLSPTENRILRSTLIALLLLTPFVITDFRSVIPDVPVRLGAVGALIVMAMSFSPAARGWYRTASFALITAIALVLAAGLAAIAADFDWPAIIRITATGFAGLVLASLFAEVMGARAERMREVPGFLTAATPEDFADGLRQNPLLGNVRILSGVDLDDVSGEPFERLLDDCPVLRFSAIPWGRPLPDEGVERARSLLMTCDATHLIRLSSSPVRIAVFALPGLATSARIESEILVAQRIGELVFSREAGS